MHPFSCIFAVRLRLRLGHLFRPSLWLRLRFWRGRGRGIGAVEQTMLPSQGGNDGHQSDESDDFSQHHNETKALKWRECTQRYSPVKN